MPPVVDQVTILSKCALGLPPSRMVQRSKEAPEQAFCLIAFRGQLSGATIENTASLTVGALLPDDGMANAAID